MLKRHYDYSSSNSASYHPTKASLDSSHTIPPSPSSYTATTIPVNLPAPPVVPDPTHPAYVPATNPTSKTTPPTTNPLLFMANDQTKPLKTTPNKTPPASNPPKKSSTTMVYLLSGIGALIFVVLIGLCLCK